jgi:hypothetical protein
MRDLSKGAKIIIVVVLSGLLYLPAGWLWRQALPSYSRFLAATAQTVVNIIDWSPAKYAIIVNQNDFEVTVKHPLGTPPNAKEYAQTGTRPTDLVSYNLSLWAALFLASVLFINARARWTFLIIPLVVLVVWHLCDLFIFAMNTHWVLVKYLNEHHPQLIDYGHARHYVWWWALELNRRIIDPFLPLLLWIIFCAKSFFSRDTTSHGITA